MLESELVITNTDGSNIYIYIYIMMIITYRRAGVAREACLFARCGHPVLRDGGAPRLSSPLLRRRLNGYFAWRVSSCFVASFSWNSDSLRSVLRDFADKGAAARHGCPIPRLTPCLPPCPIRPILLLTLSLLTLLESNFPGNRLWAWEFHPLKLRSCLSQTLWNQQC